MTSGNDIGAAYKPKKGGGSFFKHVAINAGVDVLMVTNSIKPTPTLPDYLIASAVCDGRIPVKNLQQSWLRIITAKKRLLENSQKVAAVQ